MSALVPPGAVTQLYRALLRKGRTLQLTDKDFYLRRIRAEFERSRGIIDEQERLRLIKVIYAYISFWAICCKLFIFQMYFKDTKPSCTVT